MYYNVFLNGFNFTKNGKCFKMTRHFHVTWSLYKYIWTFIVKVAKERYLAIFLNATSFVTGGRRNFFNVVL